MVIIEKLWPLVTPATLVLVVLMLTGEGPADDTFKVALSGPSYGLIGGLSVPAIQILDDDSAQSVGQWTLIHHQKKLKLHQNRKNLVGMHR